MPTPALVVVRAPTPTDPAVRLRSGSYLVTTGVGFKVKVSPSITLSSGRCPGPWLDVRWQMSEVFVARQPIFDRRLKVAGYELLFRDAGASEAVIVDDVAATATVMLNALTEIGLPRILGWHPAWINASREFLLGGLAAFVPCDLVGLEILEDQLVDDQLIAAVAELKGQGYRLALDDFQFNSGAERLLPFADMVKLDILELGPEALAEHVAKLQRYGAAVLAEKIETHTDHAYCLEAGCDLFQGFFYGSPSCSQTDGSTSTVSRCCISSPRCKTR
jgi:c-di-GMP-related signal transduction protein